MIESLTYRLGQVQIIPIAASRDCIPLLYNRFHLLQQRNQRDEAVCSSELRKIQQASEPVLRR